MRKLVHFQVLHLAIKSYSVHAQDLRSHRAPARIEKFEVAGFKNTPAETSAAAGVISRLRHVMAV